MNVPFTYRSTDGHECSCAIWGQHRSGLPGVPPSHRNCVSTAGQWISETCYRYSPVLNDENAEIADWLERLTTNKRSWGFGLCFLYLRNAQGYGWNHKRVYRIYCELALNLRIKPKKRLKRDKPEPLAVPDRPNETWSIAARQAICRANLPRGDFMADQLADGRSIRTLNVLDRCTAGYRAAMSREWTSTAKVCASKWTSRCLQSGSCAV